MACASVNMRALEAMAGRLRDAEVKTVFVSTPGHRAWDADPARIARFERCLQDLSARTGATLVPRKALPAFGGEDFRDHTYVKFSKFIVEQAGGEAWCLFDQKAYQREEFARAWRPVGPPMEADTLKDLAEKMDLPAENLMETVGNFNAAVQPGEYDLDRLDGKRTLGITPAKSNWALPLDAPPYIAIPVTGGIL